MLKMMTALVAFTLVAADVRASCTRATGDRYRLMIPAKTGDRTSATCTQSFAVVTLHNPGALPVSYNVFLKRELNPTLLTPACSPRIEIRENFGSVSTGCTGGSLAAGAYEVVDYVLPQPGFTFSDSIIEVEWDAPASVGEPPLEAEVDLLPSSSTGPNQCPRIHYQMVSEGCR